VKKKWAINPAASTLGFLRTCGRRNPAWLSMNKFAKTAVIRAVDDTLRLFPVLANPGTLEDLETDPKTSDHPGISATGWSWPTDSA
jgi:hypothetical protein